MKQKVTDAQILDYIWDESLQQIARRTVIRYIGRNVGTYSEQSAVSNLDYIASLQISYLINLGGSGLSGTEFRTRIKRLIDQKQLVKLYYCQSIIFNALVLEKAVVYAVRFWQQQGLPFGFENNACKTVPAECFDLLALSKSCYQLLRREFTTNRE